MAKDRYEGQELDERYQLQRLLDSGSFGAVYEARDLKLGRTVAVKILFDQDDTAFRKEAKLAVQFEHPNVVKVFDYGSDDRLNVGYIVMEFLNGQRLDQLIEQLGGRVPYPLIAQFTSEIGSALQLAHDRQLIHRDLKPRNVMRVDDGTSHERFVLLDLGLASQTNATSTLRNQTLDGALSPQYASPEQFSQASVDFRSDIYSFGTILFELVTGQIPFLREHLPAMMLAITTEPAPWMTEIAPDRRIPSELEEIILQCLDKVPAARPPSIGIVRQRVLQSLPKSESGISPQTLSVTSQDTDKPGGRGGSVASMETDTMRPPGSAAPDDGDIPPSPSQDLRPDPVRAQPDWKPPRQKHNRGRLLIVMLLPVVAFGIWKLLPDAPPVLVPEVEPPRAGKLILQSELTLQSGDTARLQAWVDSPSDLATDTPMRLRVVQSPEWLQVTIPEGAPVARAFSLNVHAVPTAFARSGELIVAAEADDWSDRCTIQVNVQPPAAWTLPPGFEASPLSTRVVSAVDGRLFDKEIVRVVSPDLRVEFVLIDPPPTTGAARPVAPFYIMKNKVWNALYAAYWDQLSEQEIATEDDRNWVLGATANGRDLGVTDDPQLPAFRMTAKQAHRFATWLGGSAAHLPSFDQWNLASGLPEHRSTTGPDHDLYAIGPFRQHSDGSAVDVGVDRRDKGPLPVGTSQDDVTITDVHDMAGNGMELTESVLQQPGLRLGDVAAKADSPSQLRIYLRGRSYISRQPLTWDEISETAEYPDAIGYTEVDPVVGFRVVLETQD